MTGAKTTSSRLKRRLTLQQEADTPDGAGGYRKSWSDVADLWAEIIPVIGSSGTIGRGGRKYFFGGQVQSEITHRIVLRYRNAITPAMRLMYEDRIFSIRSWA